MSDDEKAIRELIETWHRATAEGDAERVLTLMSEDVVFLVAGHPPGRGREAFGTGLRKLLETHRIESQFGIEEIVVAGDLAYSWTRLSIAIVPLAGGAPARRAGNALSILRKGKDGAWVLVRDANLLAPEQKQATGGGGGC